MPYSKKIEMPKTKRDGLANFVQMIINDIEADNPREALLKAVDLWQDIESGIYDSAMVDAKAASAAAEEAEKAHQIALSDAIGTGIDRGVERERKRIADVLGLSDYA